MTHQLLGLRIHIKFWKYLYGFATSKADGSSLNTKQSEYMVSSYFQNTKMPPAGWGNTKHDWECDWELKLWLRTWDWEQGIETWNFFLALCWLRAPSYIHFYTAYVNYLCKLPDPFLVQTSCWKAVLRTFQRLAARPFIFSTLLICPLQNLLESFRTSSALPSCHQFSM